MQPIDGACIAGIRRWPPGVLPKSLTRRGWIEPWMSIRAEAEEVTRQLAREGRHLLWGLGGRSGGGGATIGAEVENAVIVTIICDRGDRYLSTGLFSD